MSEWWTYSLSDFLLFSPRTYYRLFELYNVAIWPLQIVGLALGVAIVGLLLRDVAWRGRAIAAALAEAVDALERAVHYVVQNYGKDIRSVSVGAVPLLKLFGIVAGGWQLLRSASISQRRLAAPNGKAADAVFHEAKIATARFYADHVLSQAPGLAHSIVHGAAGALAEGVL